MSSHPIRLHHVGIVVQDLQASAAWYQAHLGFQHQYDFSFPGAQATMLVRNEARIELFRVDGATPMDPARQQFATNHRFGGINHLALTVLDLDDIVATLKANGVEVASPPNDVPNDSGDRFAFIYDNEKMLIELFQPAVSGS